MTGITVEEMASAGWMTEDEARVRLRWLAQAGLAKQVEEAGEVRYQATGLGLVDLARHECRRPAEFAKSP